MIVKEKLALEVYRVIKSTLNRILNDGNINVLTELIRKKILENINNSFDKVMGKEEFDKFCKYLSSRNISMFIDDKNHVLTVCFYNGFMFFEIKEVIEDYYKYKLEEKKDGKW